MVDLVTTVLLVQLFVVKNAHGVLSWVCLELKGRNSPTDPNLSFGWFESDLMIANTFGLVLSLDLLSFSSFLIACSAPVASSRRK